MNIEERRGRPKKKWVNTIEDDIRTAGVCVVFVGDLAKWRFWIKVANPK